MCNNLFLSATTNTSVTHLITRLHDIRKGGILTPVSTLLPTASVIHDLRGELLSRQEDESTAFRPAMWSNERPTRAKRAPGYLIGNIVHRALTHWECLTYPESQLYQLLENYARREGVFSDVLVDAVQRSHRMLKNLKNHQIYRRICQGKQRFHEVPFTQATSSGILHGVIDLLFQDEDGKWYLLDWKTEWTPQAEVEKNAQEHLLQMAIYAKAINKSIGIRAETVLCFMFPNIIMYPLSAKILDNAWLLPG